MMKENVPADGLRILFYAFNRDGCLLAARTHQQGRADKIGATQSSPSAIRRTNSVPSTVS